MKIFFKKRGKLKQAILIGLFSFFILVLPLFPVEAVSGTFSLIDEKTASCINKVTGQPEFMVCDALKIGVRLGGILLFMIGSVTLLMMIVGALYFITAQGNSSKIDEGKNIIRAAFTGLVITFFAYEIVGLTIGILIFGAGNGAPINTAINDDVFRGGWWNYEAMLNNCSCPDWTRKNSRGR